MNIEIERKFLLKSVPSKKPVETIRIHQWYRKTSKGIWERARSCYSDKDGVYFIYTVKTPVSAFSNMEDEKILNVDEFNRFVEKCKRSSEARFISKDRLVYPHVSDGLKWEVDVFNSGHHLIVAEIEIPTETYKLDVPEFLHKKILLEVTGMRQFSNKNLSNKIKTNFKKA